MVYYIIRIGLTSVLRENNLNTRIQTYLLDQLLSKLFHCIFLFNTHAMIRSNKRDMIGNVK